jgi:hypothetical protein
MSVEVNGYGAASGSDVGGSGGLELKVSEQGFRLGGETFPNVQGRMLDCAHASGNGSMTPSTRFDSCHYALYSVSEAASKRSSNRMDL